MKLVPWSHLSLETGPLRATNLRNADMNAEVSIDSTTSVWIALLYRQVKMTAHLFESDVPPLVRLVTTVHGPKTSMPTIVKGGDAVILSSGRSAIT